MTRRRPKVLDLRPGWTPAAIDDLGHASDVSIARRLGITEYAVKAERKRRGIGPHGGGRPPAAGVRRTESITVWATAAELAAIDKARGDRPRQDYVREAALSKARADAELDRTMAVMQPAIDAINAGMTKPPTP